MLSIFLKERAIAQRNIDVNAGKERKDLQTCDFKEVLESLLRPP